MAREFAGRGHDVFAAMRTPSAAPTELLQQAPLDGVHIVALDVCRQSSVDQAVSEVLTTTHQVDVLVNNAGVGAIGAVEETADDDLQAVMDTNVFGTLRMVRAVLPGMRQRGSGTIINITSSGGLVSAPYLGAYCASKHALEALSEALYGEVRPFGVRVCIVEPGFFRTEIARKSWDGAADAQAGSPYRQDQERVARGQAKGIERGMDPRILAIAVADAAFAETPPLRLPIGPDAEALDLLRRRATPEAVADEIARMYRLAPGVHAATTASSSDRAAPAPTF